MRVKSGFGDENTPDNPRAYMWDLLAYNRLRLSAGFGYAPE